MKKKIPLFLLVIWISFIFFNSLQPGNISGANSGRIVNRIVKVLDIFNIQIEYNKLSIIVRKGAHIFEFMILAILFYFVLINFSTFHQLFLSFILSISIAVIDETIQLFVSGRSGSIIDVGIDSIGVLIGLLICLLWTYMNKKRVKNKKELR